MSNAYWNRDWPGPGPVHPGDLRVSDAERSQVTDALCRHYADGRLDEEEWTERTTRATAAKTRSQLAGLLDDLPPLDDAESAPAAVRPAAHRPHPLLWTLGVLAALWLVVDVTFAALHAAMAPFHPFFPWPLLLVVLVIWSRRHRRPHRHHHHHHDQGDWGRWSA